MSDEIVKTIQLPNDDANKVAVWVSREAVMRRLVAEANHVVVFTNDLSKPGMWMMHASSDLPSHTLLMVLATLHDHCSGKGFVRPRDWKLPNEQGAASSPSPAGPRNPPAATTQPRQRGGVRRETKTVRVPVGGSQGDLASAIRQLKCGVSPLKPAEGDVAVSDASPDIPE